MDALDLIQLTALMARTRGRPEVRIGLIDGPVATGHQDLEHKNLHQLGNAACTEAESFACLHGTFVAGILAAKPNSPAPAICPGCTLLIRPIFAETSKTRDRVPSASASDLAAAILDCLDAGARVLNLSLGLAEPSTKEERRLEQALDEALIRGAIVVAAAGNQGSVGTSAITRHPWVIPISAIDMGGRPLDDSNLGNSIGRRGLSAPGDRITSLSSEGETVTLGGTSVAVPFVTGTVALLWSEFPHATTAQVKLAVTQASTRRRASIVPPRLNAAAAWERLSINAGGRPM